MAVLTNSILNQDERRDYTRLSIDKMIQTWVRNTNPFATPRVTYKQRSDGILGQVSDISFSGARIVVPSSCGNEGDTMEVRLRREAYDLLILEGRFVRAVRTSDGHTIGIHFCNVAVRDQQRLAEALYEWSRLDANRSGVRRSPISPWKQPVVARLGTMGLGLR